METWKYSQQRRLSDILSGKFANIAGEPPHATRAFEAARRIGKHARLADDLYLSFYEGTPASQVADEVEAAARRLKSALNSVEFTVTNGGGAFGGFEGLARSAADAATQSAILDTLVRVGELMVKGVG